MCEPVTLGVLAGAAAGIGTGTAAGATALGMSSALTAMQAISLGVSVGGAVMSAGAMYQQGQVAEATARNNAKVAEYAAQDAQRRGEEEAQAVQRKGAALKSSQRVALAAKGLDLTYGTAADVQDQTDFFTQADVATTRTNAAREAWNYRAKGQQALAEGKAESLSSMYKATGTLLGSAGQVADKWYSYGGNAPSAGLPSWYTDPKSTRYAGPPTGAWWK